MFTDDESKQILTETERTPLAVVQQNEGQRLQSSVRHDLLESPPDPALDRLVSLAARSLNVSHAFIALCRDTSPRLKAMVGTGATEVAGQDAFAAFAACPRALRVVEDTRDDPHFSAFTLALSSGPARFYAAAPLQTETGAVIGMLCVLDARPRPFDAAQKAILTDMADVIAREVERSHPEGESHYQMLTEMMSDFAYVYGLDENGNLRLEWISDAILQATGYSRAEVEERGLGIMVHPDDLLPAIANSKRLMEGRSVYSLARIITKSGVVRWLRGYGRPRYERDGAVIGFYGASLDVTEQRVAQMQLEESQQHYHALFEFNTDAVFSLDRDGLFISANPASEVLTGYSAAELYEKTFLPLVIPEEREQAVVAFQAALRGEPQSGELTLRRADGQRISLSVTKVPVIVAGQVVGVCGTARDITARKNAETALRESEERFRAIAAGLPVCVSITRRSDGAFLYVNSEFRKVYGFGETDSLEEYRAALFYADPRDRDALLQNLAAENGCSLHDLALRRLDGSEFWATGSFQATTLNGEEVVLAAYSDNTERRQWAAERERLLAEALARADQDPLTGLINHRLFHKRFREEVARREPLSVLLLDVNDFTFFNDLYGHFVGDDALREIARALDAAGRALGVVALSRFGGDEFAALLPGQTVSEAQAVARSLVAAVARMSYQPPGAAGPLPFALSWGVATLPDDGARPLEALAQAEARLRLAQSGGELDEYVERLRGQLNREKDGFTMLDSLVTAVDNKDRYTRRHSEDVLTYSLEIARALGLSAEAQQSIQVAALLHDVGKVGVPDRILRKPGGLTTEEMEVMKLHPMMGAVMVGAVSGFESTLEAVRHHHERWDGSGYPAGIAGERIPLSARIMAVADAFSAMTINRPYRKGMTPEIAISRLREGAGIQWDPVCVAAFLRTRTLGQPFPG